MDLANLILASVSTTPSSVSDEVRRFCERVVPGQEAKYVPVSPAHGAEAHNCFINVERVIAANGGEIAYGWIIWEGKVLWDAEFHGCWVPPDNWLGGTIKMLDVTPKPDGESQILFLPDPKRKWDGHTPVQNVTVGKYDHPAVAALIAACDEKHKLFMRHWVGPGVPIPLPPGSLAQAEAKISKCWIECGKMLAAMEREQPKKSPKERFEERRKRRKK